MNTFLDSTALFPVAKEIALGFLVEGKSELEELDRLAKSN